MLTAVRGESEYAEGQSSRRSSEQGSSLAAATVQSILRGDDLPIDQASEQLGHRLRLLQTSLILWLDEESPLASAPLEVLAQSIAAASGARRPLMLPTGSRELWVWLATHDEPSLEAVGSLAESHEAHVAIGSPQPGFDGFRTSHLEASNAQRLATGRRAEGKVTHYREVELVWLTSTDLGAAERLLTRELGELADDATPEYLRQTLARYLRNGCSITATAEELFVHRNTVVYRLHRIAALVGHPLTERRTEMDLALRLLEWQ